MRAPSLSPDDPTSALRATAPLGRSLVIAQVLWGMVALVSVGLLVWSVPLRLEEVTGLISPQAPTHIGLFTVAPQVYVMGALFLEHLSGLVFIGLAILLFWRRSDTVSVIRISMLLLAFGAALPGVAYAIISATPIWRVSPSALQIIGWSSLLIFAYIFPSGTWVPRWSRWVIAPWLLWTTGFFLFGEVALARRPALIALSYLIWIGWLGTGVCAQIYRYAWVATPLERQQSKWVLLGFISSLVGILLVSAQQVFALSQGKTVASSAAFIAGALVIVAVSALPIPLNISIAALRHNLFDIDRLINLTLVYGALTLMLGGLYIAAVALGQFLIQAVTGQHGESQVALVVSTLGVAAIAQPARRRIQIAIDRQFYRRRYDAARIAEAFATSLRSEVDLTELSQRLIDIAYHTMKPRHVSLWLALPQDRHAPSDRSLPADERPE